MKLCAKCDEEYDDHYDACPACARRRRVDRTIVGIVTVIIVCPLLFCCFMEWITS